MNLFISAVIESQLLDQQKCLTLTFLHFKRKSKIKFIKVFAMMILHQSWKDKKNYESFTLIWSHSWYGLTT